jgi:hypothetical protein
MQRKNSPDITGLFWCGNQVRKVSRDLRIKSAGRVVPGVTVEPLPPHPFHEVQRQTVPPFRKALGPLVEQRPTCNFFHDPTDRGPSPPLR